MLDSVVVVLTVPVLVIDVPIKDASTSTVNVEDAVPPLPVVAPRSHVTVPGGDSVHSVGNVPLTVSPVGSTSTTVVSTVLVEPMLVAFSVIVVVSPALTDVGLNVFSSIRSAAAITVSMSSSVLFCELGSAVVELTVPMLVIDGPVNDASTSTVNVEDAIAPFSIVPRSHVTVPDGDSVHSVGNVPLTVSPVGSTSTTDTFAASDGPLLVAFSVIVVV